MGYLHTISTGELIPDLWLPAVGSLNPQGRETEKILSKGCVASEPGKFVREVSNMEVAGFMYVYYIYIHAQKHDIDTGSIDTRM